MHTPANHAPSKLGEMTVFEFINALAETEIWREVNGYPGYFVSSYGRVKGKRAEILKQGEANGYKIVSLHHAGKTDTKRVSRLVLAAFFGPPPFPDTHAAHNDGNTANNHLTNLRWSTARENQADVDRHGNRVRGSAVKGAKLTESDIPTIRKRIGKEESFPAIARDFGVSISTISLIKLGKIWNHV